MQERPGRAFRRMTERLMNNGVSAEEAKMKAMDRLKAQGVNRGDMSRIREKFMGPQDIQGGVQALPQPPMPPMPGGGFQGPPMTGGGFQGPMPMGDGFQAPPMTGGGLMAPPMTGGGFQLTPQVMPQSFRPIAQPQVAPQPQPGAPDMNYGQAGNPYAGLASALQAQYG